MATCPPARTRLQRPLLALACCAVTLTGCTQSQLRGEDESRAGRPVASGTPSPAGARSGPDTPPAGSSRTVTRPVTGGTANVRRWSEGLEQAPPWVTEPLPSRPDPVSVAGLIDHQFRGEALAVGRVVRRTPTAIAYAVSYRSDDSTASGELDVPRGDGPFPAVVLVGGDAEPWRADALARERAALVGAGYVVLEPRRAEGAPSLADVDQQVQAGVAVVNGVEALRRSGLGIVDPGRVGLVGRALGGTVVLMVLEARPGLVGSAVLESPASSLAAQNLRRFVLDVPGGRSLRRAIVRRHGSPSSDAEFWRDVSPRTFSARVSEPVLVQHGTTDRVCPVRWSRRTVADLRSHGAEAGLVTWPGEGHVLQSAFGRMMARTTAFLDRTLAG